MISLKGRRFKLWGQVLKQVIKIRTVAFVSIIAIALSILSFIPNRAYASRNVAGRVLMQPEPRL